jgi:hypothetical protein
MVRWLERDLRATRLFWRVAVVHHGPFSVGPNQGDAEPPSVRTNLVPLLEAYGVQLVLSGHEHSYQRSRHLRRGSVVSTDTGTVYVTTGGGGAFLYPVFSSPLIDFSVSAHHYLRVEVDGIRMSLSAIAADGALLDSFTLQPRPVLSDDRQPFLVIRAGQGSLVRISGKSLAAEERFVANTPGPTQLAGASVTINGQPINLIYVSSTQIWAQTPFPVQNPVLLKVTNANGSTEASIN